MNKITHCFLDVDFRCQHAGLKALAKEHGVSTELRVNQHIIFINRDLTKLKMLSTGNVLSYLKLDKGRKVNLESIAYIPSAFTGDLELAYNKSVKKVLTKKLGGK